MLRNNEFLVGVANIFVVVQEPVLAGAGVEHGLGGGEGLGVDHE